MNTRKLPPALVIALGLGGCGDDGTSNETSTTACLIAPLTESAEGPGTGPSTDTDGSSTFGPCLIAPQTETFTATDTTASTSAGTDTDTDTDDSTSVGPCLEPPLTTTGSSSDSSGTGMGDQLPDRDAVVGKVLERGVLPPDIAEKLRRGR